MFMAVFRVGRLRVHPTATGYANARRTPIVHVSGARGQFTADRASRPATTTAPTAAYIHLPFCKRKCFYCDFPVEAVGLNVGKARTQDRMQAYVGLVCSEIKATKAAADQQPLETVSFGGGTPSLVPPHLLNHILQTLQQQYGISSSAEVSLEADPGTFDLHRLQQYRGLGVTRLSMGVQCFQEELLQICGRSHTLADVYAAIDAVKTAGMPSWSLDLISGLPKLTLDKWKYSLDQAIAADPDHISVYDLQIEEGTPFDRWYAGGSSGPLPREPEAVQMFELASHMLTAAGYEHYEISNYAKPGHRSRHNQVYWKCQPYYAFGLGAASYVQGRRFTRPRSMKAYEVWVHDYVLGRHDDDHLTNQTVDSQEERLLDHIMLSLRLSDGLSLQYLQAEFGPAVVRVLMPAIQRFLSEGLMQVTFETLQHSDDVDDLDTGAGSFSNVSSSSRSQQLGYVSSSDESMQSGKAGFCSSGRNNGDGVLWHNGSSSNASSTHSSAVLSRIRQHSSSSSSDSTQLSLADRTGQLTPDEAFALLQQRLLQNQPCGVRLTDPDGFLLSNDVISDLFADLEPSALSAATS